MPSYFTLAAAGLLAVVIAVTMGLFSKNQMPVEGKVRINLLPRIIIVIRLTSDL